jgi:ferredoxin-NADP reductase
VRHVTLNGPRGDEPRWFPATYAAWDGAELIRRIAPNLDECDVYVCGPAAWMAAVRADLARAGVPAERIHSEAFAV